MNQAQTIDAVTEAVTYARARGKTIALVPTMGALHIGHLSLIETAVQRCDFVVLSIFVNPTQFGPAEDFRKYPRPIEKDLALCRDNGVDLVFNPDAEQMYPVQPLTWVTVDKLTDPLCGRSRPGHFRGVTTVCAKLFNIVRPDIAIFGQKDAQQAIVIKRMVADLNMPLDVIVCPTVREPSGLAVSSRNQYLTEQQRTDAAVIARTLQKAGKSIENGSTDSGSIIAEIENEIRRVPAMDIEYVSIVDLQTLTEVREIRATVLIAVAAKLNTTRLIDNIVVDAHGREVTII